MSTVVAGNKVSGIFCEALGLNPDVVKTIEISVCPDSFACLDVQMYLTLEQAQKVAAELKAKNFVVNIFCEKGT